VSIILEECVIQHSKSLLSSAIILMKKKYESSRVCTNYRPLNVVTIKCSFPILTMDELIDDLFGASLFSKLDLRSGYHQILLIRFLYWILMLQEVEWVMSLVKTNILLHISLRSYT